MLGEYPKQAAGRFTLQKYSYSVASRNVWHTSDENSQHVDVHPYEEAQGLQRLLNSAGYEVSSLVENSGKRVQQPRKITSASVTEECQTSVIRRETSISGNKFL